MKTSILTQDQEMEPSFDVKVAPWPIETPFADLMLHPDKLELALMTARRENDAFAASRTQDMCSRR